jgi:hypothetical protein
MRFLSIATSFTVALLAVASLSLIPASAQP